MLGANCRTSSSSWPSPHLSSPSTPANGNHQNILNMSPSISWHLNPIAQSERTLHDQSSLCWDSKKELSCTSVTLFPSNGTAILQVLIVSKAHSAILGNQNKSIHDPHQHQERIIQLQRISPGALQCVVDEQITV